MQMEQHSPNFLSAPANQAPSSPGRVNTDQTDNQSLADLNKLLEAIRQYLNLDVAFTARFSDSARCIEQVRLGPEPDNSERIQAGDSAPLAETYCAKIVSGELENLITDCHAHPVTSQMDVTRQLDIGAYIGVPIPLSSGEVYGTLCCFDHQPNLSLNKKDVELLQKVAVYMGKVVGRMHTRQQANDNIIAALTRVLNNNQVNVVFQPVYCQQTNTYAYHEALARFTPTPYRPPNEWLDDAEAVGMELQLEQAIVTQVVKYLRQAQQEGKAMAVAINASPRLIESGLLPELLNDVPAEQVRIELTEHEQIHNYQAFRECLRPLTQRGFKICIDDVGAGFASLRHILELEPDVIKLDLSLAHNVHQDPKRQALVTGLLAFAQSFACEVVAEGVETAAEYHTLQQLGVTWFQGWYFSRPLAFDHLVGTPAASA